MKDVNKAQIRGELADIVEVIYTVKGKTNIWTYDAKGNRLTDTEENGASKIKSVIEYKQNSDLITKYGNWTFTYDANGNMTGKESADPLCQYRCRLERWQNEIHNK
ncbi:MAG: hypothetical protein HUJ68_12925, partial [Clostridia bacterium]|nr:hypothetical protein [Clostridia bacterium]